METPIMHSGASKTWAPAGIIFNNGSLFFGGLRDQALYEAKLNNLKVSELKEHFLKQFGRIRAVASDVEGNIYITTSNTDGCGNPNTGDDKLIMLNLGN